MCICVFFMLCFHFRIVATDLNIIHVTMSIVKIKNQRLALQEGEGDRGSLCLQKWNIAIYTQALKCLCVGFWNFASFLHNNLGKILHPAKISRRKTIRLCFCSFDLV